MLRRTILALAILTGFAVSLPVAAQHGAKPMPTPIQSGYVPVTGGQVWYAAFGSGEPLVLLHGGFGQIEMFEPILGDLAATRSVIAIDLQGHGRTPAFDRPMTFENMADDVAAVIRHLGYDKADLVGYSLGGITAEQVLVRHPDLIRRAVLISAVFARSGWHDYNLEGMSTISSAAAEPMKQSPMYEAFAAVNPDPAVNWPRLLDQLGGLVNSPYDFESDIGRIGTPTMLVVGDWDSVRTAHVARFFELLGGGTVDAQWDNSGMNQNRLAIIPGATHYTMLYQPTLVPTVLGFLDTR